MLRLLFSSLLLKSTLRVEETRLFTRVNAERMGRKLGFCGLELELIQTPSQEVKMMPKLDSKCLNMETMVTIRKQVFALRPMVKSQRVVEI